MKAVRTAHAVRRFATGAAPVKLPDLPYDFGALAPVISGEIMQARPETPAPPAERFASLHASHC